jgi:hypothetical protein
MTTRPSVFSRAQARRGLAAAIAAGCTRPDSVVAAAAAGPDADLDAADTAAAEHLCRQAPRLILCLSLSGHFLFRFGVTPAAAADDDDDAAAAAAADAAADAAAYDTAAGEIELQCRLTSTLPSTVF